MSHPFEVARVLMQYNRSDSMASVLKDLYTEQGVSALYRGLIPRSLHMMPALTALYLFKTHRQAEDIVRPT